MIQLNTEGRNRFVILTRRHAIKIPSLRCWRDFLFGLLNNMNEAAWADDPAHCPVLWSAPLGLAIVMPRARMLSLDEFAQVAAYLPPCRAEMKPSSWGRVRGRLVAVDYGW